MVLTLVKNRNRTQIALDAKMALDAGILRCQPAEQKHTGTDRFSSTKVYSIVLSSYFNMQKKGLRSLLVQKITFHKRH